MEKGLKSLFLNFFFSSWELFRIMEYLYLVSQKIFRAPQWQEWSNINHRLWAYLILITGLNKLPLLFQCVVKIYKTHFASTEYLLVFYNVICLTQHSYIMCISLHVYCPSGFLISWLHGWPYLKDYFCIVRTSFLAAGNL